MDVDLKDGSGIIRGQLSPTGLRERTSVSRGQETFSGRARDSATLPTGSPELQTPNTPLLMPPPTAGAEIMAGTGSDWSSWFNRQLPPPRELLTATFWVGSFLAKMAALTRPCLPFVFNLATGLPLILIAALDLGAAVARRSGGHWDGSVDRVHPGRRLDWGTKTSLALLGFHFLSAWALNWFGLLCNPPVGWM